MKKILLISALAGISNTAFASFYGGGSANISKNKYIVNTEVIDSETEELAKETDSESKNAFSVSILGGYAHKMNNLLFAFETGVDLGKSKFSDENLEIKNNFNVFFLGRVGYEFYKNNTAYLNLGLSVKDIKASKYYEGKEEDGTPFIASVPSTSKNMLNMVAGLGYENSINKNVGIFTELNYIASTSALKYTQSIKYIASTDTGFQFIDEEYFRTGEIKTKSTQFKIGARYYY